VNMLPHSEHLSSLRCALRVQSPGPLLDAAPQLLRVVPPPLPELAQGGAGFVQNPGIIGLDAVPYVAEHGGHRLPNGHDQPAQGRMLARGGLQPLPDLDGGRHAVELHWVEDAPLLCGPDQRAQVKGSLKSAAPSTGAFQTTSARATAATGAALHCCHWCNMSRAALSCNRQRLQGYRLRTKPGCIVWPSSIANLRWNTPKVSIARLPGLLQELLALRLGPANRQGRSQSCLRTRCRRGEACHLHRHATVSAASRFMLHSRRVAAVGIGVPQTCLQTSGHSRSCSDSDTTSSWASYPCTPPRACSGPPACSCRAREDPVRMRVRRDSGTAAAWAPCLGTCGAVCAADAAVQICNACFVHDCRRSASRLQRPALRRGFGSRSAGQCWTLDPSKQCSCGRRRSPSTQRINTAMHAAERGAWDNASDRRP